MNFHMNDVAGPARAITFGGLAVLLFLAAQDVVNGKAGTTRAEAEADETAVASVEPAAEPPVTEEPPADAPPPQEGASGAREADAAPDTESAEASVPAETAGAQETAATAAPEAAPQTATVGDEETADTPVADDGPETNAAAEEERPETSTMQVATETSGPEIAEETVASAEEGAASAGAEPAANAEDGAAAMASDTDSSDSDTGAGAWPAEQMAYLDGDADAGERVWRQCAACHVAEQEQNRVGPHLVDIVGRDVASVEGFRYSTALRDLEGQSWTPEELDAWIENPRGYARGTSMGFAGIRDEGQRRDLFAYLYSLQE